MNARQSITKTPGASSTEGRKTDPGKIFKEESPRKWDTLVSLVGDNPANVSAFHAPRSLRMVAGTSSVGYP